MAIGTPVAQSTVGATGNSVTTASFTPPDDCILLALVEVTKAAAPNNPTVSDSLGLTWTEVVSCNNSTSAPLIRGRLFVAFVGTGAAMTVTAAGGTTPIDTCLTVVSVTGTSKDFANFSNATSALDNVGDPSPTALAAVGANSAVITFAFGDGGAAWNQPTGYTEIVDLALVTNTRRMGVAYDLTSPSTATAWTSTNTGSCACSLELVEAGKAFPVYPKTYQHMLVR